jgi:PIN domain nuclease of toxin-antitoxin system
MRYLLDTHTIIWYLDDSLRLPPKTEEIIDNSNNRRCISSVSLWEIAIKINLGKLKLSSTFDDFLDKIRNSEFEILQIRDEYLKRLSVLPPIHKDPFDRLMVSTALVENLTIITADDNVRKYNVPCIW